MKLKNILIGFFFCFSLNPLARAAEVESLLTEKITESHTYKKIAINTVETYKKLPDGMAFMGSKFLVQPLRFDNDKAIFEKPIWTIRTKDLPLTEHDCDVIDIDTCDDGSSYCSKPCFSDTPEFLAFDEKAGKLYLQVASTEVGTGGGTYFIFVADIKKKEIRYFRPEGGPLDAVFSPSGKYLLFIAMGQIKIYNTLTDENFIIRKENIFKGPSDSALHYLGDIKWINDEQFVYEDSVFRDKFTHTIDSAVEINQYTVDIPTQKTLSTRVIKARANA